MKSRKGFADIVVIGILALIGVGIMFGPKLVGSIGDVFNGGNKDRQSQTYKLDERYPVGTVDSKGNFVKIGEYRKGETRVNVKAEQAPEKWSTKVKILISFAILLAIAFPAKALQLWLKAKANLKQLVTGIKQAETQMDPKQVEILKTNLSKKMDEPAKKAVKAIKAKIKAEDVEAPK